MERLHCDFQCANSVDTPGSSVTDNCHGVGQLTEHVISDFRQDIFSDNSVSFVPECFQKRREVSQTEQHNDSLIESNVLFTDCHNSVDYGDVNMARASSPNAYGNVCESVSYPFHWDYCGNVAGIVETDPDIIFDVVSGFDRYSNYAPLLVNPDLCCTNEKDFHHRVNDLGSQLNVPAWQHELSQENDVDLRNYISFGVTNGFLIVDENSTIPIYECKNYKSATTGPAFDFINSLIMSELENRKYILAVDKPHCIHSLGAVPKKGTNKWRPITDCSRPLGNSINNYMSSKYKEFCYTTVDQVVDMLEPGMFIGTVDIASAYRSILVHPDNWKYQGISWNIEGSQRYLLDTHICFGLRCAPYLFTQVSNFILRCLKRRGYTNCFVYLDDFLVAGRTREECSSAQNSLIEIIRSLGFYVAWDKCLAPAQIATYLGIVFDTTNMSVSIPPEKMTKLHKELEFFQGKHRATKKQIQKLCGILSHCSKVVKGGRTFSRRIIDLLKGLPQGNKRIRLSSEFQKDILWWQEFSTVFNGSNLMTKFNYGDGPHFFTDASFTGYGFWSGADWQAGYFSKSTFPFSPKLCPEHDHWVNVKVDDPQSCQNINVLELIPVWLGIKRSAHIWRGYHVVCNTDNSSVRSMINKGSSSNAHCMVLLRDIFWTCVTNNVYLTARHLPGSDNILADLLSRVFTNNDLSFIGDYFLCCSSDDC